MTILDVQDFLKEFDCCVISTVDTSGQPEAATVGFSVDDEMKFVIATKSSTRKAQNLAGNNKVAFVVGFDGAKTLQLEGATELLDKDKHQERIELHFEKVPGARKYSAEGGENYYLITPTWLRFTDYTQSENPIFETKELA